MKLESNTSSEILWADHAGYDIIRPLAWLLPLSVVLGSPYHHRVYVLHDIP